ncbi:MAG TPA: DUF1592 domain-containing protein [Polyangia bacterium]|jgi:hypothetical protein|nr:DUF1592 domain-containing protein [Polyangia bacterium]
MKIEAAALARLAILVSVAGVACTGQVGERPVINGGPSTGTGTGGSSGNPPAGAGNPGSVVIHRLNAFEYDNTINDLLGLSQNMAQKTFIPDEVGPNGFNNEAGALTISDAEFQQYFNAADSLAEQLFTDPGLTAKIITCVPASATDAACLRTIIDGFGPRAYRRPLTTDEVARSVALAADAIKNGEDFTGSVKQIVKMMLSSLPFLYRIEMDPTPGVGQTHRLSPYELGSRLSYLLWSSTPDAKLLAAAQSAALLDDAGLVREVDRMLQDPRATNFVSSFAGQWLGMRGLAAHQVESTAFPTWNESLRQGMVQEVALYFNEFLGGDVPWTQFLTAPVHFVNGPLAQLYGATNIPVAQTIMTKVVGLDSRRVGFLGLAAFLTQSSYSYRTVPTLRGKWVYQNLLGETIPDPPAGIPPLDPGMGAASNSMTQDENVRARLLAHRADPTCAACHNLLDPIGLGLENFDGIGAYRTTYGNGQSIDASGQFPDGTKFDGSAQLVAILSQGVKQTELVNFAAQQMMTYALGRPLRLAAPNDADRQYLQQIQQQWAKQGYVFKSLLRDVVLSETFRSRRGGD